MMIGAGAFLFLVGHLKVPFLYNGGKLSHTCVLDVVQDAFHPGFIPLPAAWKVFHQLVGEVGCNLAQRFPAEVRREHGPYGLAFLGM